jgi:biotin carboxyl carrier protein
MSITMKENSKKQPGQTISELKKMVIQGDTYYTTLNRKYLNRQQWIKPDAKKVISFIPGTIRQVLVKAGDPVEAGEKLLVLEAMKMMNSIYAPMTGTIKALLVKEGDRLPKGSVMIEFE